MLNIKVSGSVASIDANISSIKIFPIKVTVGNKSIKYENGSLTNIFNANGIKVIIAKDCIYNCANKTIYKPQ